MLVKILIGAAVIVAILVVVISMQSSTFRIERTAVIAAPASTVFAQVDDFRKWPAWSPYEKLDPVMKKTYDGPPTGLGSAYTWAGNSKAGEGRATIIDIRPNELIRLRLDFVRPFEASNVAEFVFKPEGDKTAVTWSLTGDKNFMFKAVHMVMNMDKMVGGQFAEGLADLKKVAEAAPKS